MNGIARFARPITAAFVFASAAFVLGPVAAPASAGDIPPPTNRVAVGLYRLDPATGASWAVAVLTQLDFVPGVTGVTVGLPSDREIALDDGSDPNEWSTTLLFSSLTDMQDVASGTWTIVISGTTPSSTEFTIGAEGLTDADFFDVPVITSPANGSTVPANTNFTWIDPTGPETAEAIAIEVNGPNTTQMVDSFNGPITVDSVSWDPPRPFETGSLTVAGLFYLRFGDAATISPYLVTSGTVQWDDATLAPRGYPDQSPRFTFGSANVTAFFASGVADIPGDVTGDGIVSVSDLLLVLSAWGPCPNCPADINGDDVVDVTDLLIVLNNWSAG